VRTRTIRQTVVLPARPEAVYEALMTTKGHEAFTESPARISPKVGGTFRAWDGYIQGKNLELVRGKTIVQAWRASEEGWPEDYFSTVTYRLTPVRNGTRVSFTHTAVPAEHARQLAAGWKEFYWEPLKRYFARQGR
jgi:uncharacterized protein YndB with AHSA1/START domain